MCAKIGRFAVFLILATVASLAHAQDRGFDLGIRLGIAAADGEPANDIPGAGVLGHYQLANVWTLGAAIDRTRYDFEEPAKVIGIPLDPTLEPIDALAEATTISVWIERSMTDHSRPTTFFVGTGLGAAFTDVPDTIGTTATGDPFDVHTEVDTEIIVSILGGVRRRFGERWYGEATVHADWHLADWRVTDRVSGIEASIDDYLTWGAHITVGFEW